MSRVPLIVGLSLFAAVGSAGCRAPEGLRSGRDGSLAGTGGAGGSAPTGTGGRLPVEIDDAGSGGAGGSGDGMTDAEGSGGTGGGDARPAADGRGGTGGAGGGVDAAADRADAAADRSPEVGRDTGADVPIDRAPVPDVAPDRVPTGQLCASQTWTITANYICDTAPCMSIAADSDPRRAIDGNRTTRFTTGRAQGSPADDEVVTVTFAAPVTISGVRLVTDGDDGPVAYRAEYSVDGSTWQPFTPDAAGPGSNDLTVMFAPTTMTGVRVIQTGTAANAWWSIHELTLLNCLEP